MLKVLPAPPAKFCCHFGPGTPTEFFFPMCLLKDIQHFYTVQYTGVFIKLSRYIFYIINKNYYISPLLTYGPVPEVTPPARLATVFEHPKRVVALALADGRPVVAAPGVPEVVSTQRAVAGRARAETVVQHPAGVGVTTVTTLGHRVTALVVVGIRAA